MYDSGLDEHRQNQVSMEILFLPHPNGLNLRSLSPHHECHPQFKERFYSIKRKERKKERKREAGAAATFQHELKLSVVASSFNNLVTQIEVPLFAGCI